MPIYEYTCQSCSKKFDQLVRTMSAAESTKVKCPECGSAKTARALSVFAAHSAGASAGASRRPAGGGCGRCGDPNGPCSLD